MAGCCPMAAQLTGSEDPLCPEPPDFSTPYTGDEGQWSLWSAWTSPRGCAIQYSMGCCAIGWAVQYCHSCHFICLFIGSVFNILCRSALFILSF